MPVHTASTRIEPETSSPAAPVSAPPVSAAVSPAALTVEAASCRSSQVSGGSTPASSKDATLYQTVDLLAPLNMIPYCVPSIAPTSATDSPKLSTICSRRSSIG